MTDVSLAILAARAHAKKVWCDLPDADLSLAFVEEMARLHGLARLGWHDFRRTAILVEVDGELFFHGGRVPQVLGRYPGMTGPVDVEEAILNDTSLWEDVDFVQTITWRVDELCVASGEVLRGFRGIDLRQDWRDMGEADDPNSDFSIDVDAIREGFRKHPGVLLAAFESTSQCNYIRSFFVAFEDESCWKAVLSRLT